MNTYSKQAVETYVKCFGFESINDKALVQLYVIIETLVFNILDNLFFVVDVYKKPALTKKHLAAVMNLMRQKTAQAGGSYTVLPSEYFGVNSGRYMADVSTLETNMNVPTVTRPAMQMAMAKGGAAKKCMVADNTLVDAMVTKYKVAKKLEFTVGKEVVEMIMASVNINIDELMTAAKAAAQSKKKMDLTMTLLNATIKENAAALKHLVVPHKKKATAKN